MCFFCVCAPLQESEHLVVTAHVEQPTETGRQCCQIFWFVKYYCYLYVVIYFDIFLIFLYTLRPNFLRCPLCQPLTCWRLIVTGITCCYDFWTPSWSFICILFFFFFAPRSYDLRKFLFVSATETGWQVPKTLIWLLSDAFKMVAHLGIFLNARGLTLTVSVRVKGMDLLS